MTDSGVPRFRPLAALEALARHQVRFVVIGGMGARAHGSTLLTNDLDICYARDHPNLERLAAALEELGAQLRGAPERLPFRPDARTLQDGDHFTFITHAGALDCLGTPAGVEGFDELNRLAVDMEVEGLAVRVAALEDIIRMKRAAGRPKDRIELEVLGALREEIDEQVRQARGRE